MSKLRSKLMNTALIPDPHRMIKMTQLVGVCQDCGETSENEELRLAVIDIIEKHNYIDNIDIKC